MSEFEYTIIAILAAVCAFMIIAPRGNGKGGAAKLGALLIMYGVCFLSILIVVWIAKWFLG